MLLRITYDNGVFEREIDSIEFEYIMGEETIVATKGKNTYWFPRGQIVFYEMVEAENFKWNTFKEDDI